MPTDGSEQSPRLIRKALSRETLLARLARLQRECHWVWERNRAKQLRAVCHSGEHEERGALSHASLTVISPRKKKKKKEKSFQT